MKSTSAIFRFHVKIFFICLLVVISSFKCSKEKQDLAAVEKIIIKTKDKNSASKITLVEDLILAALTDTSEFSFQNLTRVISDEKKNMYVLDSGKFCIHVFNEAGKYLFSFGRKGQGPGEFEDMADFHLNNAGEIGVYDFINARISFFEKNGEFLAAQKCNGTIYFSYSVNQDTLFILREATGRRNDALEIVQLNDKGKTELKYAGNFHKLRTVVSNNMEMPLYFGPASICAVSRKGVMAHTTGETYLIEFYNRFGEKFREIVGPNFHRIKVTEQDKQRIFDNLSSLPKKILHNLQFSKFKNPFYGMMFDWSGNLWVIRWMLNDDFTADVYDDSGHLISEVPLPRMLSSIDDEYAYAIDSNKAGQRIIRYRLSFLE